MLVEVAVVMSPASLEEAGGGKVEAVAEVEDTIFWRRLLRLT